MREIKFGIVGLGLIIIIVVRDWESDFIMCGIVKGYAIWGRED